MLLMSVIFTFLSVLSPKTDAVPLMFTYNGSPIGVVTREEISLLPIPGSVFPSSNKLDEIVGKIAKDVYLEPIDAQIDSTGNIVPEMPGHKLNKEILSGQILEYFFEGKPYTIEVPITTFYPRVGSEMLDSVRTMLIGRYTTFFNSNNSERTINISLATNALNNKVVFPGEVFSFNKVVGKRTAVKGYLKAPIIVRGELSEGIGGGICQVSSTLFNAVDNAGLKILQRYSHTKSVTYVPPGRDATVSWYGPDFTFKNIYMQPVLIRAKSLGNMLSVSIYSSESIDLKPRSIPGAPAILPKEIPFKTKKQQKR